ncbi:MAG: branched-chain amino acid transport system substrate-binding protein [bacterium]|jgi:branched-chain amino acid transport system substrate-binding protein
MISRRKLAGMATGIVAGVCASTAVNAADTIKLGFAVPLTGEYAPYTSVQGAKCMAEIINNAGGVDGKMFELMIQDVGTDSQTAIALSEKFLEAGAITISTIPFSDTMIPVAQLAAEYGATVIQAQSTQVEMHMGIVDNFITNVSPDPFTATAGAKFALSQGVKNVVLFTSDEGGSWSARTPVWFGDVIEAGGGKVQASLNFSFGTSDWSPQIAELKKLDPVPDAIYISSVMPDVGVLIRQMRTSGLDAWVIGSDGLDDPSLDAIGEADATILDKVAFATLAPSHRDSAMASFQAECEALDIPVSGLFPALGSDIVMAIAYGVEKSGSTDPVAVREAIRAADSITVKTVESVSFKEHGSYAQRTIPVIGFKDGKRILVSNEIPDGVPSDWN